MRRHLNPPTYTARFFVDKLHLDQNEKLAMYGVTHVIAVDGFSRKLVRMITNPVKNPITIYNALMRPLLQTEGLWQQVQVDHGTMGCRLYQNWGKCHHLYMMGCIYKWKYPFIYEGVHL